MLFLVMLGIEPRRRRKEGRRRNKEKEEEGSMRGGQGGRVGGGGKEEGKSEERRPEGEIERDRQGKVIPVLSEIPPGLVRGRR